MTFSAAVERESTLLKMTPKCVFCAGLTGLSSGAPTPDPPPPMTQPLYQVTEKGAEVHCQLVTGPSAVAGLGTSVWVSHPGRAVRKAAAIVGKILRDECIIGIQTLSVSLIYCIR